MTDPIKKKKQASGEPIGSTQPISRNPEQERVDDKASKLAKTEEGKEHMAKVGQDLDIKTGKATAKPFNGKYIPGDITKGRRDKYIKTDGTIIEDTDKNPGNAKRQYDRDKKFTEQSREKTQNVHRVQVLGEKNKASDERLEQYNASKSNQVDGLQNTTPTKKVFKQKK